MSVFTPLVTLLSQLAHLLQPLFGASAMAAAIVLFTLCVRLVLHPLARAAARGERVRNRLAPRIAELNARHKGDPQRMQRALTELYAKEGVSPIAGCLPTLLQLPVFAVTYHLFSGGGGALRDHTLAGAPLGGHWLDAVRAGGVFGPHGVVFLALFAVITAVAAWTFRRARKAAAHAGSAAAPGALPGAGGLAKFLPLLSFGTLVTAAVVPLATGLYLATTMTWTAVERALLQRTPDTPEVAPGAVESIP
ncbi:YidC/Oxa1 family membrane protein insertase [Streptantibioticus ferralitis]|uniref:Membrane protein insertase YidC n=1 Tax=Streptantibioticus ferralitis TaxID=236510 RepID=A0ABT5YV94_9ACTN|nr:YidC/Oxa1 family membrane protein insertase [Streptantibioticus ferralitis]MDF2255317.1 YidC/Oxa1 family membrane protein insertase [Streptantibioticus ferralitis]